MQKVHLEETLVHKDDAFLISAFVRSAHAQGLELEWIEDILLQALAHNCANFKAIMLENIEIIPTQTMGPQP